MGLLDSLLQATADAQLDTAPELHRRVAEAIGIGAAQPIQTSPTNAMGQFLQMPQTSVVDALGTYGYLNTGLPTQTQPQIGCRAPSLSSSASTIGSNWTKLVGILFCMPSTKIGKDEVVPNLEYFHLRSGSNVDFFCPGYVHCDRPDAIPNVDSAISVGDSKWRFDTAEYDRLRSELEKSTNWKYSGETDLLLLAANGNLNSVRLDFTKTIACNVEQMLRDGAVNSVRAFIEQLVRFGEKPHGDKLISKLSNHFGVGIGGQILVDAVLDLLPVAAQSAYKLGKHYAVRDVSRP